MEGWNTKSLGEVLRKTKPVNPAQSPDDEFDYIDVSSVSNATFTVEVTQRLKGRDAPSRARRQVRSGDVLLATIRPTLRRIAVIPPELDGQVCSTGYFVLRPCSEIDSRFLFYSLFTEHFMGAMERLQKGASYPAVTDAEVRAQPLSFPMMSEQRRIVSILDEAFDGIATAKANAERNLQNARELFGRISGVALEQLIPNSRIARLEEVVASDCTLSYGVVQPGDEVPDGLPIVRPVDMNCSVVVLSGLKRIDPTLAKSYDRTTLKGNDILLCVRGTTGTLALADSSLAGANVTRGIVPIRFDTTQLSKDFGYCLMRSEPVQTQIRAKTYGTALMQINIRDLRLLELPIPPRPEQEAMVKRLGDVEVVAGQLATTYERKIGALNELKKSLLHQAFTGALTAKSTEGRVAELA